MNYINAEHLVRIYDALLSGIPLLCDVIFAEKRWSPLVKLGINHFTEEIGTELDKDYIVKNSGSRKRFPDGPTCTYQNKNTSRLCE